MVDTSSRLHSALYYGTIHHRRVAERSYEFTHRTSMIYLDLAEVDEVAAGLLVRSGPGVVRFIRSDYLGDAALPLDQSVREVVAQRLGAAPGGPIRMLTNLRTFGHCFNPVTFYFCFNDGGDHLVALVAEVTNTPWGERHAYVLGTADEGSASLSGSVDKRLHVSPYMDMDQRYECTATTPGPSVAVHFRIVQGDGTVLDATLHLRRRPLSKRTVLSTTFRRPGGSRRVLVLIYFHAVILRLKGVHLRSHP